jgi:hypothetical protein
MEKIVNKRNVIKNYEIREELLDGREHLVVPVVMMREGVHNGSRGPLLYTEEEFKKNPTHWNGIPITINHPEGTANEPTVHTVGKIFHTHMEGDKLKAEAWIDIAHLSDVSELALSYIREQRALNVSVGVFSEEINESGEWNGEQYRARAVDYRPDHLALLPEATGACSWDDGCGIRNKENEVVPKSNANDKLMNVKKEDLVKMKETRLDLLFNETGFREISQLLQSKLDALDTDSRYHFLEEVYQDNFVFRVSNRVSNQSTFYKQSYSLTANDEVELAQDAKEVRKNISFEEVTQNEEGEKPSVNISKKSNKTKRKMTRNKKATECTLNALIENENVPFTEDDREYLASMSEERAHSFLPKEEEEAAPAVNKDETDTPEQAPVVNVQEEISKFFKNASAEDVINVMPTDLGNQMSEGIKLNAERRAEWIKGITENSKFTEDQVKNWNNADLSALYETVKPADTVDYTGRAVVNQTTEQSEASKRRLSAMVARSTKEEKSEK